MFRIDEPKYMGHQNVVSVEGGYTNAVKKKIFKEDPELAMALYESGIQDPEMQMAFVEGYYSEY